MTLEIPAPLEAALQTKAQQEGVSPECYALSVLEREANRAPSLDERWGRIFGRIRSLESATEDGEPTLDPSDWVRRAREERGEEIYGATFGAKK